MRQGLVAMAVWLRVAMAAGLGLPRQALMLLVRAYRLLLKPSLGNACRFEPTCSQYALDALQRHGAIVGSALTAGRILRCNPWCDGGCDPVAARAPRLFRALGLGAYDAAEPSASMTSTMPCAAKPSSPSPSSPSSPPSHRPLQFLGDAVADGRSTPSHAALDEATQRTSPRQAILETRS